MKDMLDKLNLKIKNNAYILLLILLIIYEFIKTLILK